MIRAALLCAGLAGSLCSGAAAHDQTCEGITYALPEGYNVVCSYTWQLDAECAGEQDLWDKWKVLNQDEPFLRPWLDRPIMVIGYDMVKLRNPPTPTRRESLPWWKPRRLFGLPAPKPDLSLDDRFSRFMIGSTIQPDTMAWLAPGETHSRTMWPAGHGQPWPSKQDAVPRPPNAAPNNPGYGHMLDVHGACFGGGTVKLFITVYYTPQ